MGVRSVRGLGREVMRAPSRLRGAPRLRRRLVLTLSLAALLAGSVAIAKTLAGPAAALRVETQKAMKLADAGDFTAAGHRLEAALQIAQTAAPLEVRKVAVTRTPHGGLGVYEPIPDGKVRGRDVALYVELAGVAHRPLPDGTFEVFVEVSAAFTYEDGSALGTKELGSHRFLTRTQSPLQSFGLDVGLSEKAPAGRYDLVLKLKDHGSGKEASAPVFFVLP